MVGIGGETMTDDDPRFGKGEYIQRLDDRTVALVMNAGETMYLLKIDGRRAPKLLDRKTVEDEWTEKDYTR